MIVKKHRTTGGRGNFRSRGGDKTRGHDERGHRSFAVIGSARPALEKNGTLMGDHIDVKGKIEIATMKMNQAMKHSPTDPSGKESKLWKLGVCGLI